MRLVERTPANQAKATSMADAAALRANWYCPPAVRSPYEVPELNHIFDGWLMVTFAWLVDSSDGKIYRTMWFRSADPPGPADPIAGLTMATMLGFTGGKIVHGVTLEPPDDWNMRESENGTRVIGQAVPRLVLAS